MRKVSATLKTAVLAPTPNAMVRSVTQVQPGERRNERSAKMESVTASLAMRNVGSPGYGRLTIAALRLQSSPEALSPTLVQRLPGQFALGLRVGHAANLRHHRNPDLAVRQPSNPRRYM